MNKEAAYLVIKPDGSRFLYAPNADAEYIRKLNLAMPSLKVYTKDIVPPYVWSDPKSYGYKIETIANKLSTIDLDRTEAKPGSSYEEFRESIASEESKPMVFSKDTLQTTIDDIVEKKDTKEIFRWLSLSGGKEKLSRLIKNLASAYTAKIPDEFWNLLNETSKEYNTVPESRYTRNRPWSTATKENDMQADITNDESDSLLQTLEDLMENKTEVFFVADKNEIGSGTIEGFEKISVSEDAETKAQLFILLNLSEGSPAPSKAISTEEPLIFAEDLFLTYDEALASIEMEPKQSSYLGVVPKHHNRRAWLTNTTNFDNLKRNNMYAASIEFMSKFLNEFEIPCRYEIKLDGIKNASYGEAEAIIKGDINLEVNLKTISGIKIRGEVILPIREGKFVEPSVIFIDGEPHIIAQSTFNEINAYNTLSRPWYNNRTEQLFSNELLQKYKNNTFPIVKTHLFD